MLSEQSPLAYYVYIDTVGVIGRSRSAVNEAITGAAEALNNVGLKCHPASPASSLLETLGVEFCAECGGFRPPCSACPELFPHCLQVHSRVLH